MSQTNLLQVIKSVMAAGIGVQSNKNRENDFENGTLSHYILVGAIATILFVLILRFIVSAIIE